MKTISIIIPVLNEEEVIKQNLLRLKYSSDIEIIFADGGSQDQTIVIAQNMGVKVVFCGQKGRAYQMNQGASIATGDILLFLHADTILPDNYQSIIINTLSNAETIAGAFELHIDSQKFSLRFIETLVNWRSHFFSLPYGDQAIFMKASVFQEVGGFTDLPIMEDFELIQRLKKRGKIAIASAKVRTSSRRWHKLGVVKTTLINQLIILGYYLGISPDKLERLYGKK